MYPLCNSLWTSDTPSRPDASMTHTAFELWWKDSGAILVNLRERERARARDRRIGGVQCRRRARKGDLGYNKRNKNMGGAVGNLGREGALKGRARRRLGGRGWLAVCVVRQRSDHIDEGFGRQACALGYPQPQPPRGRGETEVRKSVICLGYAMKLRDRCK